MNKTLRGRVRVAVIAALFLLSPQYINANFSAPLNYPGGSSSRSVAAADYDGDGDKDIALANFGDHTISILFNTGGVFAAPVNYSTGLNPYSVFAADLDGDGDKDLVTANGSANTVSILLNNGSGVFAAAVNYAVGTSPRYAYAIDVDGDLDADLAVANATTNNVSILLNNGSGVFAAAVNYAVGTSPRYLSSADLDGDLDADLAVVNNTTNNVSVLLNNGSGVFGAAVNYTVGTSPVSVYAADLDGDGDGDLVAANSSSSSNSVSVLLNSGNGTFAAAVNYPTISLPFFALAVDLDADGDRDIAAVASTNGMSILLNNGNGTFAAAVNYNAGNGTISIDAADFDTDGDTDLAVANSSTNNITLYKNNGNATFPSAPSYSVGSSPQSVVAADVDGDGDRDVLAANTSSATVSILLNNGSGILATAVNYATVGTLPRAVVASDLDGDGDKDLATANSGTNNVSVLLNNGSGVFSAAVTYTVNNQPFSITSADFDGDGDQDLAVVNFGANNGSLLFNNGNGTFAAAVTFATGNSPFSVIASDLDADGDMDLAVANSASNSITVLKNNGSGVFAVSSSPAASSSPKAIFAADVDGDTDQDLLTANSGTNTVGVFLNNGTGVFAAMVSYAVGVNPQSLVAADYDRDTDVDLIVANSNSGEAALLLNDGTGLFGSAVRYAAGRLPRSVFAADFDADGDNDVVVANEQGNNLSMLVNTSVNAAPATSSIAPISKNAGEGDFTLTVNGTSFVAASVVKFNGVDRATTFVSGTQLTALILAADLAVGGDFEVTVSNPAPGGGDSNAQSFTVNNPVPVIASISPDSETAGEPGFTLTVNGSDFVPSSVVQFNASDRVTTFVSSTQLTAAILSADLEIGGDAEVTVVNPLPGGGTSNVQGFTVNNVIPSTSAITPIIKTAGDPEFVLTIDGTGFIAGSVVEFEGEARDTTYLSSVQLTAVIPSTDLITSGVFTITVVNPLPGGGASNGQVLTVQAGGRSVQFLQSQVSLAIPRVGAVIVLGPDRVRFEWTYSGSNQTGFYLVDPDAAILTDAASAQANALVETGLEHNSLVSGRKMVAYNARSVSSPSQEYPPVYTQSIPVTPVLIFRDDSRISLRVSEEVNNLSLGLSGVQFELVSDTADEGVESVESPWIQTPYFIFETTTGDVNYFVRSRSRNYDGLESPWSEPMPIPGFFISGQGEWSAQLDVRLSSSEDPHNQLIEPHELLFGEIRLTHRGEQGAQNVFLHLQIPPELLYVPGSLSIDGVEQTDAPDQDFGQFGNDALSIIWPSAEPLSGSVLRFDLAFNTAKLADVAEQPEISLQASVGSGEESNPVLSNMVILMPDISSWQRPVEAEVPVIQDVAVPTREEVVIIEQVVTQEFSRRSRQRPSPQVPEIVPLTLDDTASFFNEESFRVGTDNGVTMTGKVNANENRIEFSGTTSYPFSLVTLIFNDHVTVVVVSDANGLWQTFVDSETLNLSSSESTALRVEAIVTHENYRSDRVTIAELTIPPLAETGAVGTIKGARSEKIASWPVQDWMSLRFKPLGTGLALAVLLSPFWWWAVIGLRLLEEKSVRAYRSGRRAH